MKFAAILSSLFSLILLVSTVQAETYYFHNDHLGTPQALTDKDQNVVWKASYTPFGEANITKEDVEMNLRFPGQYFDEETGLHYNYYRDYDPTTGRYIQSDPIGLIGGMSTYGYALQNPINLYDPYGLWVPPSLPDWFVDTSAGIGDGILATLTFGFVSGQSLREVTGAGSVVNICAAQYRGGRIGGTTLTLAANAFGAIPKTLTHFTTSQTAARSIVQTGITPSRIGLFGGGRYASSIGAFPKNIFVPPASNVAVAINNTRGYVRTVPGTFVQPTTSGAVQLAAMNAGYGYSANVIAGNCDCTYE